MIIFLRLFTNINPSPPCRLFFKSLCTNALGLCSSFAYLLVSYSSSIEKLISQSLAGKNLIKIIKGANSLKRNRMLRFISISIFHSFAASPSVSKFTAMKDPFSLCSFSSRYHFHQYCKLLIVISDLARGSSRFNFFVSYFSIQENISEAVFLFIFRHSAQRFC